ncbi:MAG: flavodoxin family protein [Clostridiales Family XIII bacterium]|nr:flavodoxin family protein [Clostridia bacterium]MDY3010111.1 flavodoxin family protein [Clostridiales Family XIII bacterium]
MKKKILLITGSPRKHGNTSMMADAFEKGAHSTGHTVFRFSAGDLDLRGCTNCNTCFSKGDNNACSTETGFNEIASYFGSCDTVIFCTPLYWYSFPAQLKAVIDKIYSFAVSQRPSNIKESFLLVCGECPETRYFEGIVSSYQLLAEDRQWNDRGHYIVTGVVDPGDIDKNHVKKIEQIGSSI